MNEEVIIYQEEHVDEYDDHDECKKALSMMDRKAIINTLEVITLTNKFVFYAVNNDMSLNTNKMDR